MTMSLRERLGWGSSDSLIDAKIKRNESIMAETDSEDQKKGVAWNKTRKSITFSTSAFAWHPNLKRRGA